MPRARQLTFTRRNAFWLAAVLVTGLVAGYFLGWVWGLAAVALVLVASEIEERTARARHQRQS